MKMNFLSILCKLVMVLVVLPLCTHASRPLMIRDVLRSMCRAINMYSAENEGRLPYNLYELDSSTYDWPDSWEWSLESFIYVAPQITRTEADARDKLPNDIAMIIIPEKSGIYIAYLSGNVEYLPGGYSSDYSPSYQLHVERLRSQRFMLLVLSGVLVVLSVVSFWLLIRKSSGGHRS